MLAFIERQKLRRGALQACGGINQIGINGEMRDAAAKTKERCARQPPFFVLSDRIKNILAVKRVLQLRREDWHPI